jgi:hypothetical protein
MPSSSIVIKSNISARVILGGPPGGINDHDPVLDRIDDRLLLFIQVMAVHVGVPVNRLNIFAVDFLNILAGEAHR